MENITNLYNWYLNALEEGDSRVKDWFLMNSFFPTLAIGILYLVFVSAGKRYMATREAFNLKTVVIVYDFFMVALSAYMTTEMLRQANLGGFGWVCNFVDYGPNGLGVFFILRKKNEHVSFLHVYHHFSVLCLWWIGARFVAGGDSYFSAMQNSAVHTIMYGYYALTAIGYNCWWKKYLTQIQMIQFFLNIMHTSYGLFLHRYEDCSNTPIWMSYGMITYMVSLFLLFLNFFIKAYIDKSRAKKNKAN